jgi:hypothetical protein
MKFYCGELLLSVANRLLRALPRCARSGFARLRALDGCVALSYLDLMLLLFRCAPPGHGGLFAPAFALGPLVT